MSIKSKFINYINDNVFSIIIIIICLFVIFPFVYLSQYNIPGASDDLLHGWFKADKAYFDGIWSWYSGGYNGRFANAFFMQMPGRIFLEPWFGKLFPVLLMVCFFLSINNLLKTYHKKSFRKNLFSTSVIFAFFLAKTPDIHQFYWFSGSTVYVVPAIFYFLFLSYEIKNIYKPNSGLNTFLSILFLFFIIGSHENWMIIGFITSVIFFIRPFLIKQKPTKYQYWIIGFAVFFTACVVFAPGTTFRMTMEGNKVENADFWASLSLAGFHISRFINQWFLNFETIIILLGVVIINSHKKEHKKLLPEFSNAFFIYMLFIVLFAGIFILLYSLGHFVDLRIRGLVPTFFVGTITLLFFWDRVSTYQLVNEKLNKISKKIGYFILSIGLILVFSSSTNVKNAYIDIFSGNAKEAAMQSVWVQNYIKNSNTEVVTVPQLNRKTKTLYTFIVPDNPEGWYHWSTTIYFKKKKILVDYNHELNDFIKIHSNPDGIAVFSDFKFCQVANILIADLKEVDNPKIKVEAEVIDILPESSAMLVFESDPIWQGYKINEIVDESGHIDFVWNFPQDSAFNIDIVKVYFFNPNEDVVLLKSIKSRTVN